MYYVQYAPCLDFEHPMTSIKGHEIPHFFSFIFTDWYDFVVASPKRLSRDLFPDAYQTR